MSETPERVKLTDFLRRNILDIAGPINNEAEAKYLTDKLYELSGTAEPGEDKIESLEGGVLYRALHKIWRMAYDETDTIPNGERSPYLAYNLGVRNLCEVLLQPGFSVAPLIGDVWRAKSDQLKFEEQEKREQEEFLKNRPPAD